MVTAVEEQRAKYEDRVTFIILYQREAHPGQMQFASITQPETYDERLNLAQKACEELSVATTIVIDGMDNAVRIAYGGLPNSAYIIDGEGRIVHKEGWAAPDGWDEHLDKLLKGDSR
ncbi:deiodinase-like protein [Candidatus Zixiibacteriota bacterium]